MPAYFRFKEWLADTVGIHVYKSGTPLGVNLRNDLARLAPTFVPRTIFDIGANVGQTAQRFSKLWPNADIFSFEPVQKTYQDLVANTRSLAAHVKVFKTAFSDRSGEAPIYLSQNALLSTLDLPVNPPTSFRGESETVQVVSLDDWCRSNRVSKIDFLKIDTEGHDLKVLKGGASLLGQGRVGAVFVETFLAGPAERNNTQEIVDWLSIRDFRLVAFYDQQLWLDGRLFFGNCLFVHPDALGKV